MSYAYAAANRLSSVTDWNSNATSYSYDDAHRMTTTTLPSGTGVVSSYSYDNANRLTAIVHDKAGTIASASYTLDNVGNRTGRVDQQGTHSYAYDNLYRLTSVTYPGPATTSYAFDAFGNRTSKTDAGGTTAYAYDDAGRITAVTPPSPAPVVSYTWDNNGNLTNRGSDSFSWDYEDRMTSATVNSVTSTFAYRGDGLRDSRTTGGNTTTFTWDIAGGLPVVLDDGSQYVYGAGLTAMKQSGSWFYYLADGLGSTMAIVDSAGAVQKGYTYDVYGKPTATGSLSNEFDFAGQQTDPTGLQYLRARYMDPETGTFLSREPMAILPGWTGNHFAYGAGNPARYSDPTGFYPIESEGSACGSSCWLWGPDELIGYDLTGWWIEFLWENEVRTDTYRGCRFVGEYRRCTDTDPATADAWRRDSARANAEYAIRRLLDIVLAAVKLPKGYRKLNDKEQRCLESKGLSPHILKDGVPGRLSEFELAVNAAGDIFAVRHGGYASGGEEPTSTNHNVREEGC